MIFSMARTKIAISVTLDKELLEKLDEVATKIGQSRSAIIEYAIKAAKITEFDGTLRMGGKVSVEKRVDNLEDRLAKIEQELRRLQNE
jgi:metal-responsive CopG/Arc/MetJ family transcriptional regulator